MNAKEIIEKLQRMGFSQYAIAKGTDVSQPTIWRIANGQVSDVRHSTYKTIVDFYRIHSA